MRAKVTTVLVFILLILVGCQPKTVRAEPPQTRPTSLAVVSVPVQAPTEMVIPTVTMAPTETFVPTEEPLPVPIDPLLVRIVDKDHPVDQAFIKEIEKSLVDVDSRYFATYGEWSPLVFDHRLAHKLTVADLCRMLKDANNLGLHLNLRSSFRDITAQETSLQQTGSDASRVSLPTESQHHTGLAFDFTTLSMGNELGETFGETPEAKFLREHAREYGIVESYVANHGGIDNEPWHWLYLSPELAKRYEEMKAQGIVKDPFEFQALYPQP